MRLFCILFVVCLAPRLSAQGRVKEYLTDSGRTVVRYFVSGQVSTMEWMDKDDRWGRSLAFKKDGSILVDHATRRIAAHASVHFEYHRNGAVSKCEISDAPDAGIQWYRSTTTFNDRGDRTDFWEEGHDDRGLLPRPDMRLEQPAVLVPPVPRIDEEPHLFVNEVYVVNKTKWPCAVAVTAIHASPALKDSSYVLLPGDSVHVGSYTIGAMFGAPETQMVLKARRSNKKRPLQFGPALARDVAPERRAYALHILARYAR